MPYHQVQRFPALQDEHEMIFYRLFGFDEVVEQVQEESFLPEGIFGDSQVMITTDPTHPGLRELQSNKQQVAYLVLPDEEIQLGLIRPLRFSYQHMACGTV